MKRSSILCGALSGALILALTSSPAMAICTGIFQPLQNVLGGSFNKCPDQFPVAGFAYALSGTTSGSAQATVNSGPVDIICENNAGQNGQLIACQFEAGVPGDGNITVQFDWGGSGGFVGCPNSGQALNTGRNVLQIVANDGSSILVSVGYSFDLGGYFVDFANPFDQVSGVISPLSCNITEAGLKINQQTASPTSYSATVNIPKPLIHSDCDPGTVGHDGFPGISPTCDSVLTAFTQAATAGKIYSNVYTCGQSPDARLAGNSTPPAGVRPTPAWTLLSTPTANADGSGTASFSVPRPTTAGDCAFVGATQMLGGLETLAVSGAIEVVGQGAAPTKALDVKVGKSGGNVTVSFRTASELDLAGFNILTDSQGGKSRIQVNSQMIAPKGIGGAGASYSVSIPQANFKGGKTVYVESVSSSGAKTLSDPAKL